MRGVAEQHDAVRAPHGQRVAEVDRGDEDLGDAVDEAEHGGLGVREGSPQVREVAGGSPGLLVDLVGGHEGVEGAEVVAHRIGHAVAAATEPHDDLGAEARRHVLDGDERAPCGHAREAGLLLAEEQRSDGRAQPVGADEQVALLGVAVLEVRGHAVGRLVERDEPGAQADALLGHLAHERFQEVGTVQADVLLAVVLLLRAVVVDEQPAAVVHAAPLGRVDRDAGGAHEVRGTEIAHRLHGVGGEAEARADLAELGRALEHARIEARALQRDGGGHAADASSRDQHPHARWRLLPTPPGRVLA